MIEVIPNRLRKTLIDWLYSLPIWVRENIYAVSIVVYSYMTITGRLYIRSCQTQTSWQIDIM